MRPRLGEAGGGNLTIATGGELDIQTTTFTATSGVASISGTGATGGFGGAISSLSNVTFGNAAISP